MVHPGDHRRRGPLDATTKVRLSLDSEVRMGDDHVSCHLADETIVLGLSEGAYYRLNPVGSTVWRLLRRPRTVRRLRDALLEEYDVDEESCTRDLLDLLEDLHSRKLIHFREGDVDAYPA